jgi:hypothetical protein
MWCREPRFGEDLPVNVNTVAIAYAESVDKGDNKEILP